MDELTLEGKRYVSSKRAAKITGYAKDYVGQLCREGRVDARLVGRSWYVLEDSLREHRFGKGGDIRDDVVPSSSERLDTDSLEERKEPKIRYTAETAVPIQTKVPKNSFLSSEIQYVEKEEQTLQHEMQGVSSMQDTWHEWFSPSSPQEENKSTHRTSIPVEKEKLHTGKTNEINIKSEKEEETVPFAHLDKISEGYGEDAVMRNGKWQEVINHTPLLEKTENPSHISHSTQMRNSLHGYTTIQKESNLYPSHSVSHQVPVHSQKRRVISGTIIIIAIFVSSFAVINFFVANQGYGNTGILWSSINYIGGTRTFINK